MLLGLFPFTTQGCCWTGLVGPSSTSLVEFWLKTKKREKMHFQTIIIRVNSL